MAKCNVNQSRIFRTFLLIIFCRIWNKSVRLILRLSHCWVHLVKYIIAVTLLGQFWFKLLFWTKPEAFKTEPSPEGGSQDIFSEEILPWWKVTNINAMPLYFVTVVFQLEMGKTQYHCFPDWKFTDSLIFKKMYNRFICCQRLLSLVCKQICLLNFYFGLLNIIY